MSLILSHSLYTVHFPKTWILRDEPSERTYSSAQKPPHANMIFHVSAGDYITTLATILRFFEETVYDGKTTKEMRELQLKTIREVIGDLLYLNKNYIIVPKKTTDEKSP